MKVLIIIFAWLIMLFLISCFFNMKDRECPVCGNPIDRGEDYCKDCNRKEAERKLQGKCQK